MIRVSCSGSGGHDARNCEAKGIMEHNGYEIKHRRLSRLYRFSCRGYHECSAHNFLLSKLRAHVHFPIYSFAQRFTRKSSSIQSVTATLAFDTPWLLSLEVGTFGAMLNDSLIMQDKRLRAMNLFEPES